MAAAAADDDDMLEWVYFNRYNQPLISILEEKSSNKKKFPRTQRVSS